jgi:hypothetical protein
MTKRFAIATGVMVFSLYALPGFAQQSPMASNVISSAPGKATATRTISASVVITAIDKATRTLTLKSPDGSSNALVAGPEVKNFAKLKVGNEIVVEYEQALSLSLRKPGQARQSGETVGAERAPDGKPGGVAARLVTAVVEVVDVNPAQKTITVKGEKGDEFMLDVKNPEQFTVVKKGDLVDVNYYESVAITVKPAPKKNPKK